MDIQKLINRLSDDDEQLAERISSKHLNQVVNISDDGEDDGHSPEIRALVYQLALCAVAIAKDALRNDSFEKFNVKGGFERVTLERYMAKGGGSIQLDNWIFRGGAENARMVFSYIHSLKIYPDKRMLMFEAQDFMGSKVEIIQSMMAEIERTVKGGRHRTARQQENYTIHKLWWNKWRKNPGLYKNKTAFIDAMRDKTGASEKTVRNHINDFSGTGNN